MSPIGTAECFSAPGEKTESPRSHAPAWEYTRDAPHPIRAGGSTERSSIMKRITENSRKRTGWVKVLGMGLSIAVISWGTPAGAGTGPGHAGGRLSSRTQATPRLAADLPIEGTHILLARGGGGGGRGGGRGGKGGGSGQCDGSGSGQGQGKGYGAKDGTGTGERPQDGSGSGAGSGQGNKDGAGKGSGSGSGRGNR